MRSNRPIPSNSIFTRYLLQIAFTDVSLKSITRVQELEQKILPHNSKCMECQQISVRIVQLQRLHVYCTNSSSKLECAVQLAAVFRGS